jgi:alcohol dehydrogenase class IV
VAAVEKLRNDIGIPARLRDLGVTQDQLRPFAEKALGIQRILRVNPRSVTLDDLQGILAEAF